MDRSFAGRLGHALAAPAADVGRDLERVVGPLDARLRDDPPTTGASAAFAKRTKEIAGDLEADELVGHPRLGHRVEHALDDLADGARWQSIEIRKRWEFGGDGW